MTFSERRGCGDAKVGVHRRSFSSVYDWKGALDNPVITSSRSQDSRLDPRASSQARAALSVHPVP